MRTLAPVVLLLACLVSGCTSDDPGPVAQAEQGPMAVEVLDVRERVDRCNNAFRDQEIVAVRLLLTNAASGAVDPAEYDVTGRDQDGAAYPMCWPDEVAVGGGRSLEVEYRFYGTTADDCDLLKEVVLRQRVAGVWVERSAPTGLRVAC